MKKVFLLSILLFCVVLCVWSLPRIGAPDPYLTISGGPSISANASGTYTYYIRETGTTVPTHPDPVSMTISGTAMGLGWIDFKITSITINGSNHLTNSQYGEAPTEEIGYMAAVVGIPLSDSVENDDFSFPVRAASWTATPGTYNWSASGLAVRKLARWDGSQWVVHNDTSDPAYRHSASGSGSWTVKKTNVCSFCKRTGVSSATAHHVPCPNPNCNAGRAYWNCYGVPPSHALLATCSSCNAANVYACSGHPESCYSGSGSGNSGNSGDTGSSTMLACGVHGSGTSGDHSYQASCSSTDSYGTCTGTGFYACLHSHSYPSPPPPSTVSCGRSACTTAVSSTDEHRVGPCSTCGASYWSCGSYASYSENQHRVRTCRRSGCGNTWQRCTSDTPNCSAQSGSRCWAR